MTAFEVAKLKKGVLVLVIASAFGRKDIEAVECMFDEFNRGINGLKAHVTPIEAFSPRWISPLQILMVKRA
jgi:hypothetical protein